MTSSDRLGDRRRGDVLPGRVARAAVDQRERRRRSVARGGPRASRASTGEIRARVHSIAARASGLNQSISGRPRPPRRGCRGRRWRRRRRGARPRRRVRARSPTTSPRCQTASTVPTWARTASRARRLLWMSDRTAIRMDGQRSSGPLTTAAALARRDRAGYAAGAGPRRRHDDQRVAVQRRRGRRAATRAGRRPARRAPAAPAASSAARSPRFQATRTPPGASSGTASSTRSARRATARAVTHGQAPRCAGSRPRASARTSATAMDARRPGRRPAAPPPRRPSRGSGPSCRSTRRAAPAARAARSPAAGPGSRRPSRGRRTRRRPAREAAGRRSGCRGRGATATSAGSRIGGQVDRRGPGEQQPDVAVDRGPLPGGEDQAELAEPGLEGVVVGGGEWWEALDARRERLTRGLQGTPPVSRADRPAPRHSRRRSFRTTSVIPCLRPSVRFVAGSPRTPRGPRYPGCPSADAGRYEAGRGASTGLSTKCPRRRGFVDKSRSGRSGGAA